MEVLIGDLYKRNKNKFYELSRLCNKFLKLGQKGNTRIKENAFHAQTPESSLKPPHGPVSITGYRPAVPQNLS